MDYIDNFFRRLLNYGQPKVRRESSFVRLSEDQLEAHIQRARYGTFQLTGAIRPSYDLQIVPIEGYRHNMYHNRKTGTSLPCITAAASRKKLMDLFHELLEPLGEEVDVVLETSHRHTDGDHADLYCEHIDLPVLESTLYDFEDVLLDDGKAGIAVLNHGIPFEVKFDEHKLLMVHGYDLSRCEEVLHRYRIECREKMKFIDEAEHMHVSDDELYERFQQLGYRLGVDTTWQEED